MGLIILDATTFDELGITITGAIISTKGDAEIRKIVNAGPNGDEYRIVVYYDIYASADAYNARKTPILANKQLVISVLQYQIDVQTPFDIIFTALMAKYPSGTVYQPGLLSPLQLQLQGLETKRLELKVTMDTAVTNYNNLVAAQATANTAVTDATTAKDTATTNVGLAAQARNDLTAAAEATLSTAQTTEAAAQATYDSNVAAEATAQANYDSNPSPENKTSLDEATTATADSKTALDTATAATVTAQADLTAIQQGQPYLDAVAAYDAAYATLQTANTTLATAQAALTTATAATAAAKIVAHTATQAYLTAVTNCQGSSQTYLTAVTTVADLISAQELKLEAKLTQANTIKATATTNLSTYTNIVTSVTTALAALA